MPDLPVNGTGPARPYRDKCPNCYCSLYYSSDADEQMCQNCFWLEGDKITGGELPLSLSAWHVMMSLLWKQYKANLIPYEDLMAIVDQMDIINYK